MRIRFPRLMAIARRMVPGAFVNPATALGPCRYCGSVVLYADGDHDLAGQPRHSRCERLVTRSQLDRISADRLFMHVLGIVRELPSVRPHAKEAVRALPARHGAREMASFIDAMLPHVEMEPTLTLPARRDTVVALRNAKRSLLGLENETRPL